MSGRDSPPLRTRHAIPLELTQLKIGLVIWNSRRRELRYRHNAVSLTKIELALLSLLASQPGRLLTRQDLRHSVWGSDTAVSMRTIDAHIAHIRRKLQCLKMAPDSVPVIQTVWGLGYKLKKAHPASRRPTLK